MLYYKGDFVQGGLCPRCKIHLGGGGGGDYVLVVKFSGGGLCLSCKIHQGDYALVLKFMRGFCPRIQNEQGHFVQGDIVRIPLNTVAVDVIQVVFTKTMIFQLL